MAEWRRNGLFPTEEGAVGAFELAYQQALDGLGASVEDWMGLSAPEYRAWFLHGTLPPQRPSARRRRCPGAGGRRYVPPILTS